MHERRARTHTNKMHEIRTRTHANTHTYVVLYVLHSFIYTMVIITYNEIDCIFPSSSNPTLQKHQV